MKKYAFIFVMGIVIILTATACRNEEHTGSDEADTVSVMPEEIPVSAPVHQDTVVVPPADPAMDTTTPQAPKM